MPQLVAGGRVRRTGPPVRMAVGIRIVGPMVSPLTHHLPGLRVGDGDPVADVAVHIIGDPVAARIVEVERSSTVTSYALPLP